MITKGWKSCMINKKIKKTTTIKGKNRKLVNEKYFLILCICYLSYSGKVEKKRGVEMIELSSPQYCHHII